MTVEIFRVAFVRAVSLRLWKDAGINPTAADGRPIGFERAESWNKLPVGGGVAVDLQELFKGSIGPVAAGGFVGLLSLFNMVGRFFWASTSDFIGRKPTYAVFFTLGAILYYFLPRTGANYLNSVGLFVGIAAVLLSMYGGGFATIPAYLRDLFGTYHVSAIAVVFIRLWPSFD